MAFLYGDSTESQLETDFLGYLRDVVACAAELVTADHRARELQRGVPEPQRTAATTTRRAEQLGRELQRILGPYLAEGPGSPLTACAERIACVASEAIGGAVADLRAASGAYRITTEEGVRRERAAGIEALAALVRAHDLPDAEGEIRVRLAPDGSYRAELEQRARCGVRATLALQPDRDSAFARVLTVEALVEQCAVPIPERRGVLRKRERPVAQHLERMWVAELVHNASETLVRLRARPDLDTAGYDLIFDRVIDELRLVRVVPGAEPALHTVAGADAAQAWALQDALAAEAEALAGRRTRLVAAAVGGTDLLVDGGDLRLCAERLIAAAAPTARAIEQRSPVEDEYQLKRIAGDGRREELYLRRDELRTLVADLPLVDRAIFAPLGLHATPSRPATAALDDGWTLDDAA